MGSGNRASSKTPPISGLREKHQQDLEKLTLTSQPFKTLRFFVVAVLLYVRRSTSYLLANVGWLMLFSSIFVAFAALLVTLDGPHVKVIRFRLFLSVALARDVSLLCIRESFYESPKVSGGKILELRLFYCY